MTQMCERFRTSGVISGGVVNQARIALAALPGRAGRAAILLRAAIMPTCADVLNYLIVANF
jgi:hypothetical protein